MKWCYSFYYYDALLFLFSPFFQSFGGDRERFTEDLFSEDLSKNPSILVTLQVNTDTNVKCFSPFFGVRDFVLFLNNEFEKKFYRNFDLFLRSHPKYKFNTRKYKFLSKNFIFSILSFDEDIDRATLVITINSTTGLEAIMNKKGLISFGNSYYSKFLRFKYISYMGNKIKVFIFKRCTLLKILYL